MALVVILSGWRSSVRNYVAIINPKSQAAHIPNNWELHLYVPEMADKLLSAPACILKHVFVAHRAKGNHPLALNRIDEATQNQAIQPLLWPHRINSEQE
jgi:hypothetical protein